MPTIDNIQLKRTFKKHRPWLLFDEPPSSDTDIDLPTKTEYKVDTNRAQTGHKSNTKPNTKQTQTEHKKDGKDKTEHKLHTEPNTGSNTNRTQTEHKPNTNRTFSSLVGLQRIVLIFLFQQTRITRSKLTQELSLFYIADTLKIRLGSIKTTLVRLESKRFIKRVSFKNGRSGWSQYEIPDSIYSELVLLETEHKLNTKWVQTEHKVDTEPNTELNTTAISSSSFLNIKNTTTSSRIPEEFEGIDFETLSNYGFTEQHLIQIIERSGLSKEMIQDSLDAFSFDLRKNNKAAKLKTTPLNCIMGTLTKGRLYNPPENYIAPQQESMILYLAAKKAEKERQEKIEKESCDLAFNDWRSRVGDSESEKIINEIAKENPYTKNTEHTAKMALRHYYYEKIWPTEKKHFFEKALGTSKNTT